MPDAEPACLIGRGLPLDLPGWRDLIRRVSRATRRPADAEDLLHSAFLRLEEFRSRHAVQNPVAFVVRAAVNLSVDERRHERVRAEIPESVHDLVDLCDGRPFHDDILFARERLARVSVSLAQLTPRTREIFLVHRIAGLKYREIACRLDITVSAVEKHVAKATQFLAEWIEEAEVT